MTTCVIFAQHLDDEQGLCIRFNTQGKVDFPLATRSIQEIRHIQQDARTIIVISGQSSSLHEVELPWLGERKARAAFPYALEEQLAQNVTTLHFAFDRSYYKNNRYLVVVTDRQYLVDLIAKLDTLELDFEIMTLDWFALKNQETCIMENGLLVNDDLFKGSLTGELAMLYLENKKRSSSLLIFKDSLTSLKVLNTTFIDSLSFEWIAERLLQTEMINLCQGDLRHDTRHHVIKHWYQGSAALAIGLLTSVLLNNMIYLHALNNKNKEIDKKIAVIYHEFFPEAKQVISPRFRISQLLTTGNSGTDTVVLWSLLDKFAKYMDNKSFTIEQFRFQNRVLSITLVSNDFSSLEKLQQDLQQDKVNVTQSQATSQEHKVLATLELSL